MSWWDRLVYRLGFYRGWNVHGRAEVQAAVERATAESVPVLVPAQRAGEQ